MCRRRHDRLSRLDLVAALGFALAGCQPEPAAAPAGAPAPVVPRTVVVERSAEAPLATVPATVTQRPGARVAVTAGFPGVVRQVHVAEGDPVRAGQLLASIVSREALALAAERSRAEARLALARANASRIGQLAAEGVVAAARADEAAAALREAEVELAAAGRMLARANASADGIVRLVAPIAGRIARVAIETGGAVDAMTAPFVIDSGRNYALELQLPERLAPMVRPGMGVLLPDGSRTTLASVAPGLDPVSRSVMAIAPLASAPGLLAGSSLSVVLLGADAVVVPSAALTRIDGADMVFVRDAEGFRPVRVVPGGSAGGRTTVLEGLSVGATIAVSNLPELRAGAGS